jgi:predicted dehydrogenase
MRRKQLLLVGAGQIAESHAAAIARRVDVSIASVVDPDASAAQRLADRWHIGRTAPDLTSALAGAEFDGVIICSPTAAHHAQALRAIDAGLPVLVEKPIAADLDQACEIVDAGTRLGIPVIPAQILRFLPMFDWAKQFIRAGSLGEPVQAIERRFVDRADNYSWWRDLPAFLVSHWGSHSVDLICYLLGTRPKSAYCQGRSVRSAFGAVDDFSLQVLFNDEFRFTSAMSFSSKHTVHDIVLIGTEATLVFDCYRGLVCNGSTVMAMPEQQMLDQGFDAQIDAFCRAIEVGTAGLPESATFPVTVAMAALDAAERSVASGDVIAVAGR